MKIERITPAEARARQARGVVLIDVREPHERAGGHVEGSVGIPRAELEADPTRVIANADAEAMLICQAGARSLAAAERLHALGYIRIASVDGGTARWDTDGHPMSRAADPDFHERYARHLRLPEVGVDGQRRLQDACVVMVGAGGLGSPAAFYLVAAGVGRLVLIDDDVVDRSNLQRQILHTDDRVGVPKVRSAQRALAALNPTVRIDLIEARVGPANVDSFVADADVVVDGSDNFATRYLLNDACVWAAKPLVHGAVHRFDGQVSVFDAGRRRGAAPCYRCLFPLPPPPEAAPNCAEAGVLGVLPGVIGLLQATEAIKLLLGLGESLAGRLLHFDALGLRFRETRLRPDPDCPVCAPGRAPGRHSGYANVCAGP